jgi:hypothetical protein
MQFALLPLIVKDDERKKGTKVLPILFQQCYNEIFPSGQPPTLQETILSLLALYLEIARNSLKSTMTDI